MGVLFDFPPPETSPELFLAVLEALPVATFVPLPGIIGVNEEGDIVVRETPNLHEIPFLRALCLPRDRQNDKNSCLINSVCASLLAGGLLMTAANQAIKSLGCSIDDIADTLKAEPFRHVLVLLGNLVGTTMSMTNEALFKFTWETEIGNVQKAIEAVLPGVQLKKRQRQASIDTNQQYEDAKLYCIDQAKELWKWRPLWRFCDMEKELQNRVRDKYGIEVALDTIYQWLKSASKAGTLDIPVTASRRGRPRRKPIQK